MALWRSAVFAPGSVWHDCAVQFSVDVFTDMNPGMKIHETEIFGPMMVIMKAATLDESIQIINDHHYGNGASIYTQYGQVSIFADVKVQWKAVVQFFTESKVIAERYWPK